MKKALELFKECFTPPPFVQGGKGRLCLKRFTGSSDAFALAALADRFDFILAVTAGIPDAERLFADVETVTQETGAVSALYFPHLIADDPASYGQRLKTVQAAKQQHQKKILVAPFAALTDPLPRETKPLVTLKPGKIDFSSLASILDESGYTRTATVANEGEFSVRGGILDVWSPGEELPARAEFFGDDLESVRLFNPATQLSVERAPAVDVYALTGENSGENPSAMESLLPEDALVVQFDHSAYDLDFTDNPTLFVGEPAKDAVPFYRFESSALPGFAELGANEAHHPELFEAAKARLDRHLKSAGKKGLYILSFDTLSGGFECDKLLVVAKSDRVFAKKTRPRRQKRIPCEGGRFNDFDEIEFGQYVVHVDYGVGRFIGSCEIVTGGQRSEVFTIEYEGGAKLHVPSSHAHLLSRYIGVKGETVRLHSIDGKRWAKDRKNAERAVADLASSLLETQARRETAPGFAYDISCEGLDAFESAFPYEETLDQKTAIDSVKADMASTKPMDRLICGDAGYGKTEVAMRAAFIAAMNGKQTAVLAPTTVLAEQHFETFTSRFDGTPVRIESVSRFQSDATHKGTFERLRSGACDIVIGTHAILSEKIAFRDLGLIIIDEEQRFGVRHKEFLKRLRATADVLTLSATPIPRTLYLSMTGARDLSLIKTPPRERVAVETNIVRSSDGVVADAIRREIARAGQVFFLHNRISSIHLVEKRLQALVPGIRIVTAHGRMDSRSLAAKMRAFENGSYDMLLSTTIIESGIDIPRANTIIIDRADMFGIAELYQLRGRVGRSARKGHAYFLLPEDSMIDSDTRERLDALRRNSSLGSGFNLALRDLEIRGAGNLLGAKQSGHIAAVGFALYCKLLKRTVQMLKGEKINDATEVKLNLDFINFSPSDDGANDDGAALPYEYVEDDALRIGLMKRLALAETEKDVSSLKRELLDRFGPLPDKAKRLVNLAKLRVACAKKRIGHLDVKDSRAVIYRANSREITAVLKLKAATADAKIQELRSAVSKM